MSTQKGKNRGKPPVQVEVPEVGQKVQAKTAPERFITEYQTVNDLISLIQPESEEFLLSTKGMIYPFEKVRIRQMTSKEEKRLASITVKTFNKHMNYILKECVIDILKFI